MAKKRRIMIVAGEASGDTHAAKLVSALRACEPETEFEFFGSAGPRMRSVGVDPVIEADNLSIVGLPEIARALPMFLGAARRLRSAAALKQPEAVILVDFPEFNLKLAKWLKKKGFTVIYYISPQLWAWRKYRLAAVKKYIDLMITILPFEKDWYSTNGVTHVEYVGSPLAREIHPTKTRDEFFAELALDPDTKLISFLPGSRTKEISRILPVMIDAGDMLADAHATTLEFLIPVGSEQSRAQVEGILRSSGSHSRFRVVAGRTHDALFASDAAAITSGTATLEAGILGTPLVIVYKTSKLNYRLLEPLIRVPHYGLINLIAEERLATELIQADFTPGTLAAELERLIDPAVNTVMRANLKIAADRLGHGGASKRAAEAILRTIATQGSKQA